MEELIIDESNFDQYFFDVRKHPPQPGQVLAKFRAFALFGAGDHKKDIIRLLKINKAKEAALVMQKIHFARMPDCYRICREMCEDLLKGLTEEEVENKDYEFVLEAFYYAKEEHIPDDPHWETIKFLNYNSETKTFSE